MRRLSTLVLVLASVTGSLATPLYGDSAHRNARLFGLVAGTALGGVFAVTEGSTNAPRLEEPGAWDLALTVGSVGAAVATSFVAPCTGPECCRWCDAKGGRPHLNGLDGRVAQSLRWTNRNRADRWSDFTLSASMGQALGYTALGNRPAALRDVALLGESYAVTLALTHVTKKLARRPRPYAHREDPPAGARLDEEEARVSFFSGHSSTAFTLAVATGTIAFARHEKNAGVVLGSGLALAATTGYLRMAADRHYLTDVLVGALVGSAAGYLVPHLHRPSTSPPVSVTEPLRQAPRSGLTVPLAVGGRRGALTAAYADGPSMTLHLAW